MGTQARRSLRLLIIEDRADDAELLLFELRRAGFDPAYERVETADAMRDALAAKKWDIVISDFSLPTFDALRALAVLKASGQDIPLIVASGTIGEEAATESLRAGARDFIVKDRPARLAPAIDRELREARSRALLRQTEDQLRHSQKLEAVGQLAAGVAHDFNNVLAVIMLNAQMLIDGIKAGKPDTNDATEILAAAKRAADLTRQLLAFGRQQVMQLRVVDLNDVVANVEKMLRRLIGEDIEIAVLPAAELGKVEVDVGQIEQVILNLAVNARDAMAGDGGKLTIETVNVELTSEYAAAHVDVQPGAYVMLAVSDNGAGMAKETQARIFEPFFTTKEVGRGTGLGLSTVFGIVKQSGGHIFVYSEVDVGTTFRIYLPRTDRPLTMRVPPPSGTKKRGHETILVVEDETSVRHAVTSVLARSGYTVLRAGNGEEALSICENHPGVLHVLLTDIVMPRMNGREVAERARVLRPLLKVLFMSGYTNGSVVQHGVIEPDVAFLPKPFTPEGLLEKLREVLVVDDEPALLRAISRNLESVGHTVEKANNGREAVQLLAVRSFDVIVTDITMPDMNGIELLCAARERDLDVPVVLMTGAPTVETSIRAIEYGALRYLVKPFEESVLREVVGDAVRLHEIARLKRQALELVGEAGKRIGDLAGLGKTLDRAIAGLWMAYQPIVSISRNETYAYEALLRSNEPSLPHPGAILEAAERLGRLPELGRAIRAHVATAVASAPAEQVFVNLHPLDLLDDELYVASSPLGRVAERVVLEITERAALDGVKDATTRIAALRKLGFRVALDDLGAGYAGLTSLAQLEPDVVKFDMSLVAGIHLNSKKKALVESMARLFTEMDIRVIAEGVEDVRERDVLTQIGCDLLQGYLFAKPAPPFPPAAF